MDDKNIHFVFIIWIASHTGDYNIFILYWVFFHISYFATFIKPLNLLLYSDFQLQINEK